MLCVDVGVPNQYVWENEVIQIISHFYLTKHPVPIPYPHLYLTKPPVPYFTSPNPLYPTSLHQTHCTLLYLTKPPVPIFTSPNPLYPSSPHQTPCTLLYLTKPPCTHLHPTDPSYVLVSWDYLGLSFPAGGEGAGGKGRSKKWQEYLEMPGPADVLHLKKEIGQPLISHHAPERPLNSARDTLEIHGTHKPTRVRSLPYPCICG